MADILFDARKIAMLLLIIVSCSTNERRYKGVTLVVTIGHKICVGKLGGLTTSVFVVLGLDAKHSLAVVANENDVHIRWAVDGTASGGFGHDGELDLEIHFVICDTIPTQRVLRADPEEEVVG